MAFRIVPVAVGRALPSGVVIDVIPVELSVRIGQPPQGYRYGIVDGDIVKLAVGTALVVDAILYGAAIPQELAADRRI